MSFPLSLALQSSSLQALAQEHITEVAGPSIWESGKSVLSTIIVRDYSGQFNSIFIFAYINDLVLGGKSHACLHAVVYLFIHNLLSLGVTINKEKTKFSGKYLYFIEYKFHS